MAHKFINFCNAIVGGEMDRDARVNELIDKDTRWWNVPLVKEIFNAYKAERICSMAISSNF
jgi:hypothetical protein